MCTLWNRPIVKTDLEVNFGWARGGFQVAIVGKLSGRHSDTAQFGRIRIQALAY